MEDAEQLIELGHSYFRRASIKRDEAFSYKERRNYPESISASQECMELSLKAIFYYFHIIPEREHEFSDKEFAVLIKKMPEDLAFLKFPKLLIISQFWGRFYTTAKYGKEMLGIGPEKIFEKEEADLALSHAEQCLTAAVHVRSLIYLGRRFN